MVQGGRVRPLPVICTWQVVSQCPGGGSCMNPSDPRLPVSVTHHCVTRYPEQQQTLLTACVFCGPGIWKWLSWVLWSRGVSLMRSLSSEGLTGPGGPAFPVAGSQGQLSVLPAGGRPQALCNGCCPHGSCLPPSRTEAATLCDSTTEVTHRHFCNILWVTQPCLVGGAAQGCDYRKERISGTHLGDTRAVDGK